MDIERQEIAEESGLRYDREFRFEAARDIWRIHRRAGAKHIFATIIM